MKSGITTNIVLLLTALTIAGCATAPETKRDPYSDADSQRERSKQAQDELTRDTAK